MSDIVEPKPCHVADGNFAKRVLAADHPVLVDFWAPSRRPCDVVAPLVEQLAGPYAGKVDIVRVNVEENPQTAGRYQISSVPTLLLFKHGQVVARHVGAVGCDVAEAGR